MTAFYVNGVQSGAAVSAAPVAISTPFLAMGSGTGYFIGAIDEARIFTFAPGQFQLSDLGFYAGAAFTRIHPKPWFSPGIFDAFYLDSREFVSYSGWWDLWYRFRGVLPFGTGVNAAQVEVYVPNVLGFPDKLFTLDPVNALPNSGGHADTVAYIYYGSPYYQDLNAIFEYGYGRGITNIAAYTSGAFEADVLQLPSYNTRNGNLPSWNSGPRDVLNISESMGNGGAYNTIRALDYLIDSQNVLACTSFQNSSDGPQNVFLASEVWNSLVVGHNAPMDSAYSGATYENVGVNFRVKPDLVTATRFGRGGGASSWASPTVASAAAFLLEQARSTNVTARATNNYVLKAIILAGASKSGLVSPVWDASGTTIQAWDYVTPYVYSNNPPAQPLDRLFGAGLFNINNAYTILTAGEQTQSATNQPNGWACGTGLNSTNAHRYWFSLKDPQPEFSAMLVCNRHIQDDPYFPGINYAWYVTELKLELFNAQNQLLASSDDPGNNVNHIWMSKGLGAGLYYLKVSALSDNNENYGLAWRTISPTAVPVTLACQPQGNGTVKVICQGVPVQPYKLFRTTDLTTGNWTQVGGGTSDSTGRVELIDPAPPTDQAYYRAQFTY
jgi:hypothetical protein